jgi:hypothetical protein
MGRRAAAAAIGIETLIDAQDAALQRAPARSSWTWLMHPTCFKTS